MDGAMKRKAKRKMRAVFERGPDGWWVASVPRVPGCHTQGRTLAQARERLREALAVSLDDAAAGADLGDLIVPEIRLPKKVEIILATFKATREKAESTQARATEVSARAARILTGAWGVSLRDAADLLGLSHQRVAQILEETASRRVQARG